jgi:hypothetical protein
VFHLKSFPCKSFVRLSSNQSVFSPIRYMYSGKKISLEKKYYNFQYNNRRSVHHALTYSKDIALMKFINFNEHMKSTYIIFLKHSLQLRDCFTESCYNCSSIIGWIPLNSARSVAFPRTGMRLYFDFLQEGT